MAISNSIVQKSQNKTSLTAYLSNDAVRAQVAKVVGGKDSTRFISSIISAVQATPALQDCTNSSILSGALQGEALKLPPSPQLGFFYLVPFNNKKKGVTEAQFILSAKGYKQLAMRSGQYADIDVIYIHEGEYLGRDKPSRPSNMSKRCMEKRSMILPTISRNWPVMLPSGPCPSGTN